MSDVVEVAFTSDASGQLWNLCAWDPRAGTSLMTYRGGGAAAPRSVSLLGNDYLLCADSVKPVMRAWALNSQEPVHQGIRMVCPGRVSALAASPDGCYCVAGIGEKVYVWLVASGCLLAVTARHYQPVTCIKFVDDGSHFATAGEDGMILVWPLAYLISTQASELMMQSMAGHPDPRYKFSDHSLPIKDMCIGHGGMRARLVSVSMDCTCKIYDLSSGSLLLSVVFDVGLTAVALDPLELNVLVGSTAGNIYQFGLYNPPRTREYHMTEKDKSKIFVGHSKSVTCLSVSQDGLLMLSGSNDETVKVWDIPSRQCTRVIPHKGPVSNAFLTIAPKAIFCQDLKPTIVLHSFQRNMDTAEGQYTVEIMTRADSFSCEDRVQQNISDCAMAAVTETNLLEQIAKLKQVNEQLYKFSLEKILRPQSNISVEENVKSNTSPAASKVDFSRVIKLKKKRKNKNRDHSLNT